MGIRGGRAAALLLGAVLARAGIYLVQGVHLVHDDWGLVGHQRFLGVVETSSQSLWAASRPVQWLTFTAVYGVGGESPVALLAIVTLLNAAVALLLWRTAARFLDDRAALAVALVWVLLPNHTTLTAWASTSYVLVGLGLLLLGVLALADGRWYLAAPALALSVWGYELFAAPALVAALVVPGALLREVRPPLRLGARAVVVAAVLLATARSLLDPQYETSLRLPDPFVAWWGHFGTGLVGTTEPTLLWLGLAGGFLVASAAAAVVWALGRPRARGREAGPTLVVAGLVLLALGLGAGFGIALGSVGMADRLYAFSSIGSAVVVVGLARWLATVERRALVPAAAALVLVCVVGQVVALGSWSRAGQDVEDLIAAIERDLDDPGAATVAVGPEVPDRNGVRGLSGGETAWVVALRFGPDQDGEIVVAHDQAQLDRLASDADLVRSWDEVLAREPDDEGALGPATGRGLPLRSGR